eukprot:349646-Chlamydomonas_euryale.AAC.4
MLLTLMTHTTYPYFPWHLPSTCASIHRQRKCVTFSHAMHVLDMCADAQQATRPLTSSFSFRSISSRRFLPKCRGCTSRSFARYRT